jgi:hypothetical protein
MRCRLAPAAATVPFSLSAADSGASTCAAGRGRCAWGQGEAACCFLRAASRAVRAAWNAAPQTGARAPRATETGSCCSRRQGAASAPPLAPETLVSKTLNPFQGSGHNPGRVRHTHRRHARVPEDVVHLCRRVGGGDRHGHATRQPRRPGGRHVGHAGLRIHPDARPRGRAARAGRQARREGLAAAEEVGVP